MIKVTHEVIRSTQSLVWEKQTQEKHINNNKKMCSNFSIKFIQRNERNGNETICIEEKLKLFHAVAQSEEKKRIKGKISIMGTI